MHELSLCEAIADTVRRRADGRPVLHASVRIGYLRQAVPASMSFCWDVLTGGTDLGDCELDIEHVPAVVLCSACGERTSLDLPVLACALCGTSDVMLESGEELMLVSIELTAVS